MYENTENGELEEKLGRFELNDSYVLLAFQM